MRTAKLFTTVFLAAFLLLAMDAIAEDSIYRWVDEDGVVHFGNQPVDDASLVDMPSSEPTNTGPAPGLDDAGVYAQPSEPSRAQQQREERQRAHEEAASKNKLRAAECERAHKAVAQLEPAVRVLVKGEDGKVYRMDDNDRLEALNKAKTFIEENCGNN